LPAELGWFPEITTDIEAIILGMHARPTILNCKSAGVRIENLFLSRVLYTNQNKRELSSVALMENNNHFNDFACDAPMTLL
jgi:hypothetical protein